MSLQNLQLLFRSFSRMRIDNVIKRGNSYYKPPRYRPPHWYVQKDRVMAYEMLTQENKQFIEEVMQDNLNAQNRLVSPLNDITTQHIQEWNKNTRRVGLLAKKIGNYPLWSKDGKKMHTTLLQVVDNHVIKYTPPEDYAPMRPSVKWQENQRSKKYGCLLVGSETIDPSTVTKEYCGIFNSAGMLPKRHLCRFSVSPNAALQPGTPLYATHFRVGDYVDVRAKTIDRGFQGVMKRWGFKGMPASHGVTKTHRRPGNIGAGGEKARVWPGTKMPGHMGNRWRTHRGVKILRINTKYNVLWMLGKGIPGETGALCYLYDTVLPLKKLQTAPPFPTQPTVDDLPLEYYDESVHPFEGETITYEES